MPTPIDHPFEVQIWDETPGEPGIYTWDINSNLVFADGAVARLFGLDPKEARHGLPLELYLDKVHPEDRPSLAKTISDTIVADIPQQHTYRVRSFDDTYQAVAAFGRAFHNRDGTLVAYSGMVVPTDGVDDKPWH